MHMHRYSNLIMNMSSSNFYFLWMVTIVTKLPMKMSFIIYKEFLMHGVCFSFCTRLYTSVTFPFVSLSCYISHFYLNTCHNSHTLCHSFLLLPMFCSKLLLLCTLCQICGNLISSFLSSRQPLW
jgi:hypothetical protein